MKKYDLKKYDDIKELLIIIGQDNLDDIQKTPCLFPNE